MPRTGLAQGPTQNYVPGQVIVGYKSTAILPASSSHLTSVGTIASPSSPWRSFLVQLDSGVSVSQGIAQLMQNPDVAYAEPNYLYTPHSTPTPSDQFYSLQYGPQQVRADAAWGAWAPVGTIPVTIAVIDSGVDSTHRDFSNKTIQGYNSVDKSTNTADNNPANAFGGHGTFIAGLAGADINNGIGIAGIAGWAGFSSLTDTTVVKIMPIRVVTTAGEYRGKNIYDGIQWAVDNRGSNNLVINLSYGVPQTTDPNQYPQDLQNAVTYAWNNGCVVVASAGNDGSSTKNYPAAFTNVISVASTQQDNRLASNSNYGTWVLTAAPGPNTISLVPNDSTHKDTYVTDTGGEAAGQTSFAAPHVAGEAALLWAQNPYLTNQDIYNLITQRTDAYTPFGSGVGTRTISATGGRVNVYKALLGALGKVIATPDLDGDGKGDLIWQSPNTGMVSFWLLDASSSLGIRGKGVLLPTLDVSTKFVGYGKFGTTNVLIWQNTVYGTIQVWQLDSTNLRIASIVNYTNPAAGMKVVAVGDLDNDGNADLVLQDPSTGNVNYALLTSAGFGKTGTVFNFNVPSGPIKWKIVGTLRLDPNFPSTILLQDNTNGSVYYWMMKKDSSGNMVLDYNNYLYQINDSNWKVVSTPVTQNGTPELVFQYKATGSAYYWLLNKGNGASNPPSLQSNGTLYTLNDVNWQIVGTPSLDGTAKPGVLLQNASTGGVYFWFLDSTATTVTTNNYILAAP